MKKLFLFDIEGTTTDISFVHKILFPYARKNLKPFILAHQNLPEVAKAIADTKTTVLVEEKIELDLDGVIEKLTHFIDTDRKYGPLKELQGLIWDKGYAEAAFQGHIYDDVRPYFERIKERGFEIGIYSSGSVHAQKLIFGFSAAGDLTPMISYYFDTKVGGKREEVSYKTIAKQSGYAPSEITFFSDIPEELAAATAAGLNVKHVLRPGTNPSPFPSIPDFSAL